MWVFFSFFFFFFLSDPGAAVLTFAEKTSKGVEKVVYFPEVYLSCCCVCPSYTEGDMSVKRVFLVQ